MIFIIFLIRKKKVMLSEQNTSTFPPSCLLECWVVASCCSGFREILHQPPHPLILTAEQEAAPEEANHSLEHPRTGLLKVPQVTCPAAQLTSHHHCGWHKSCSCPCPFGIRAQVEGSFHSGRLHCLFSGQTKGLGLDPSGN